mmetsp:Transcript_27843/g.42990  ORF Transcript_27843/g.42990 Transcript_27843/m.42990 type:complete len:91 (+) Transcript_27843:2180-2452(+)
MWMQNPHRCCVVDGLDTTAEVQEPFDCDLYPNFTRTPVLLSLALPFEVTLHSANCKSLKTFKRRNCSSPESVIRLAYLRSNDSNDLILDR